MGVEFTVDWVTAALIIGVVGALAVTGLALLALRTGRGRALARAWAKGCYRVIMGPPVEVDPLRVWKGTAQGDQAELRVLHVGDCSLRAMDTSHDFYAPPGYPKTISERLLDEQIGMEFGHYFTITYEELPEIDRLKKVTKLSGDPDVILVHTGANYQRRLIIESTVRMNQLRLEVGRRLGRHIFTAHRYVMRPLVRLFGRHHVAYHGTGALEQFLDRLQQAWPKATIMLISPFPLELPYPSSIVIHDRVRADLREMAKRRGMPCFEYDELIAGDDFHGANGYNLNKRGSELVGNEMARWIVDEVVSGQDGSSPQRTDDAHWRRHGTWQGVRGAVS